MDDITPEMARAELARRELAKRSQKQSEDKGMSLKDIFGHVLREQAKQFLGHAVSEPFRQSGIPGEAIAQKAGYGALPAAEQIPVGIREGAKRAKAGLTGGEFIPSPVPEEYGAGFGRSIGQMGVQGAIDAPATILGGLLGGVPGAIAGGALMEGAQTPGTAGERAKQTAIAAALPVAAKGVGRVVGSLPDALMALSKKINPKKLVESVRNRHDAIHKQATGLFEEVEKTAKSEEGKKLGLNKVDIDPEFIDEIGQYVKTPKMKRLLEKAKTGDYSELRKLNTELFHRGTKAKSSPLPSDQDLGETLHYYRDQLNDMLESHFTNKGETDLAGMLRQARERYRHLKQNYYQDNKIAKMVDKKTLEMPANPMKLFSKDSVPMKNFRRLHPELAKGIETHMKKQDLLNALSSLSKLSTKGLIIGGAGFGGKKLLEELMD